MERKETATLPAGSTRYQVNEELRRKIDRYCAANGLRPVVQPDPVLEGTINGNEIWTQTYEAR